MSDKEISLDSLSLHSEDSLLYETGEDDEESADLQSEAECFTDYKTVKVSVFKGAIEKEKVDVIVNSTSSKLKLTSGRGSRALLEAAGEELQKECDQKYPKGITQQEIAVTGPGNLKCKIVCHGTLLKYGTSDAEKVHMQFISKCLAEMDTRGFSTIALPGLTTGFLKFPKQVAARNACRAVGRYIDANPDTKLKEAHFVIHPEDTETLKAFVDAVKFWDLNVNTEIERKEVCRIKINQVSVMIKIDKLEEEQVDMIVNSVGKSLNLDTGTLSKAIATAAGQQLKNECRVNYPSGLAEGNVVVTSAGNLKCKKICHACVPSHKKSSNNASKKNIKDIVIKCLEAADKDNLESVAFPALGSRYRHYPSQTTAQGILSGIDEFSKTHTSSSVKQINIVIYGEQHKELAKAFEDESIGYQGASAEPERWTPDFCRQQYHKDLRPPNYWTEFTSDKSIKLWKTECDEGYHKLVDVDSTTHKAVEKLILSTWQQQKVGHGRDAVGLSNLNYTGLKVLKVQRLENIDLYENYSHFRARLFHKAGDIGVFEQLDKIPQSSGNISTTANSADDSVLKSELYPEINEHFLFHGTKADTYNKILSQGLDFRMAGEKGMFGQGMYLAESSTKADQYTDSKTERTKDEKKMFLVRSCLGKIHLSKTAKHKLHRPPCFQSGCESDSCEHSEFQRCDSVVGDGVWIFREFVTYHHYQNYPEYLITYVRV
ncbi:protein mono-ADP-ribosyltransferase PARP15-like [Saccostrea echinata]|uniref:protein mono-ADP-ribosyltransferase PARP15-like n=1 Tax=Saccostrea echinata TaxID=191078 RepID=UPI002A823240|nr:protein mono-ADP-ribosyltransferase PARP15-like [Saccostrea echinata]